MLHLYPIPWSNANGKPASICVFLIGATRARYASKDVRLRSYSRAVTFLCICKAVQLVNAQLLEAAPASERTTASAKDEFVLNVTRVDQDLTTREWAPEVWGHAIAALRRGNRGQSRRKDRRNNSNNEPIMNARENTNQTNEHIEARDNRPQSPNRRRPALHTYEPQRRATVSKPTPPRRQGPGPGWADAKVKRMNRGLEADWVAVDWAVPCSFAVRVACRAETRGGL